MATDTLYGRPSDNICASATLSLTTGAAAAGYPLTNLQDLRPDTPFKCTGVNATIVCTFGAAKTLQAIALAHHNLYGLTITVTNNGGVMASQNLVVPAVSNDGLPVNPWIDLRSVAGNSAAVWTITIAGAAANVAIGELLLIQTLRSMPLRYGCEIVERHPALTHRTEYDVKLSYGMGLRYRRMTGMIEKESERASLLALHRDARGTLKPWLFILESDVNDAMFVAFDDTSEWAHQRQTPAHTPSQVKIEELIAGLAL